MLINKHAPVVEKSITKWNRSKWLPEESLKPKKKVRRHARIYRCTGEVNDKEFRRVMKTYRNHLSYQHS